MSYGLEFRRDNLDLVLDQDYEVACVAEKGTISGTRLSLPAGGVDADFGGKWYRNTSEDSYFTTVELTGSYTSAPLLAIRAAGGATGGGTPVSYVFKNLSTNYNRIRFTSASPVAIDWILITGSGDMTPTVDANNTYGLQISDGASTLFDSRWQEIVSLVDIIDMPDASFSATGTGTPSVSLQPSFSSHSIPSSPGCFMCVNGLYGMRQFYEYYDSEANFYYGGGYFGPSVYQENDTTIRCGSVKTRRGSASNSNAGTEVPGGTAIGGKVLIFRYLNF